MAYFLGFVATICFVAAFDFSIKAAATIQTVQQQMVIYLGLGFTTLTGVCAPGLAAALFRLRKIETGIKAQNPPQS